MDAHTTKLIFKMISTFLNIRINVCAYDQVVMGIDKLFAFSGDDFLYSFDVFHCHFIRWIWNA